MASVPIAEFRATLPDALSRCAQRGVHLIVRPRGAGKIRLVQLDDLDGERLARVRELAFRVVETSPGNYQAWLAKQTK